jgi:hypothetical protein
MMVKLRLKTSSQPMIFEDAINTYQKGSLYCIKVGDVVYKYPIQDIFDIKEEYGA